MEKTHVIEVEGVGSFEVRRRTMRSVISVAAEFNRLTEGAPVVSDAFAYLCDVIAYLKVMVVKAPDGWDVEGADPDSADQMGAITRVYNEVREAEARFRGIASGDSKAAGQEA